MTKYEIYRTLGLQTGASMDEIKEAYRNLVKRYHPDLGRNGGDGIRFSKVVEAYKTLTVTKKTGSLVDFPVKNVKKKSASSTSQKNADIFSLGNLLEHGKTVGMRAFAARSLGNSGKRTAYAFLRKALNDTSELVIKTAVEAIGNLQIKQSYGELSSLYSRGSIEIREAVLLAVQNIGIEGAFKDILFLAKYDSDKTIRLLAQRLFGQERKAAADE